MRRLYTDTFQEDTKLFHDIDSNKVKCEHCGHSIIILRHDRVICNVCYQWVYKNKEVKFKYKMLEAKERNKHNERCNNQFK